ncbi:MAG: glycosyltransferase, partial [Myxococcaceae bacterium]|nr:glycosyltransferase [Myxococcaceae bacterium]
HREDMPAVFAQASIVCLPSYREGMPKALLEAAAAARALVTTDAPGCRDAVDAGRAGVLVPVRDAAALTEALLALVDDEPRQRVLGRAARTLAEARFDEQAVLAEHLRVYARLTGRR